MPRRRQPELPFPVKLTQAQRKAVAEIAPELAKRLKLDEKNQRAIPFTLAELRAVIRNPSPGLLSEEPVASDRVSKCNAATRPGLSEKAAA